ncbi:MAG: ABC transporter substrate-binding protein [Deltaproteobacteria bacterium]|nr:ABC transporter substrate-binding protein [Deltaproteobacteria bacterium]
MASRILVVWGISVALLLQVSSAVAQKKPVIGVSLASSTNPFYVAMEKGMVAKAQELGVTLRLVRAEEDQVKQLDGLLDLVQAKVDIILISPISSAGGTAAYEAARAAKIPVLSVARSVDPKYHVAFVGSDWIKQGERIGEWLAGKLRSGGKVGMLLGPAGASVSIDMENGFKKVVGKRSGIRIVAGHHSALTKADGLKLAEDMLTAVPDLHAVYAMNDELALGAVQAVKTAKKRVIVTGFNGVPPAVAAVKAGDLAMTIALKPMTWGKLAVQAAVDHVKGKSLPRIVEIETVLVDQSNVAKLTPQDLQ